MQVQSIIMKDARRNSEKIAITNLKKVKSALILKYGSLTDAAKHLKINYVHFSAVLAGRLYLVHIVSAIQHDLNLADDQVLEFWPLLRTWPRESRRVV